MKLKKYNDFNQINEADQNDGANILPQSVKDDVNKLLGDLQDECNQYDLLFNMDTYKDKNNISLDITILSEELFTEHVRYLIDEWNKNDTYPNVEIYKKLDLQSTELLFSDNDDEYIIPIITTMSDSNMNNIKYNIWINTYVAKKL